MYLTTADKLISIERLEIVENMVVIFAIIGKTEPLYEAEIVSAGVGEEELAYLHQFILHASLDMVQSAMWSNNAT